MESSTLSIIAALKKAIYFMKNIMRFALRHEDPNTPAAGTDSTVNDETVTTPGAESNDADGQDQTQDAE